MKTNVTALAILLFCVLTGTASAQGNENQMTSIEARPVFITINKTTSLIFPFAIRSVDRGSQDVLARQVDGVDNILQLKAGKESLPETNLTVITADGNLYLFLINYKTNPADLVLRFSTDSIKDNSNEPEQGVAKFKLKASTDAEIVSIGKNLLKTTKRVLLGLHERRSRMNLKLRGVYVRNDVLYFQLECKNRSKISYDVDMLRFFIRDQYRSKRTAVQEVEIKPYAVFGNSSSFEANQSGLFVVAIPKFTIPFAKFFTIAINEKNGARNLHLNLSNHLIVDAKSIGSE